MNREEEHREKGILRGNRMNKHGVNNLGSEQEIELPENNILEQGTE